MNKPLLVIHGGAIFGPEDYDPEKKAAYEDALTRSLRAGYSTLEKGGRSIDAICEAIYILEDCGLFDAGRGAVYTSEGTQEFDASIMDGKTTKAGAIAGVKTIKHPIAGARAVLEHAKHLLLIGQGAEQFARKHDCEMVHPSYFHNEFRYNQYLALHSGQATHPPIEHGTVGAVALDQEGNLAAGTSTGGLEDKLPGRVGDSPIIGAATYANNQSVAVSCTGQGEYFIRESAAFHVHALMAYRKMSVGEASQEVLGRIKKLGGLGGLIVIDADGNIATPYTTESMYRGVARDGEMRVWV